MALAAETKKIVTLFEYTDDDVNKGVKEFLRQMGMFPTGLPSSLRVMLADAPVPR